MADFLTTRGVSFKLEEIIINAKKHITLVSPYLKISKDLYNRLIDASNRNIRINIIYGKDNLTRQQHQDITSLNSVYLYFCENLHAKCYFNESEMIITSMNMYDFSERNNREMGVFIDQNQDKVLFEKTRTEVNSIIDSSILEEQPHKSNHARQDQYQHTQQKSSQYYQNNNSYNNSNYNNYNYNKNVGHCIRCKVDIDHNPERPFCYTCFITWSQYENMDFQENYCHSCGSNNYSSMRKPQCRNCYVPLSM
ncbi:phospholipase D family protein [uncultured Marivirga sp.]|uniref:phospholipase D family protein n=1 Tax=uncultured Marivirga sp. TaxID=1123707 RepID=UPI0030ED6743|tara:strand:- start:3626 stop:4381 length:756 start_codon:yes stop_codon:yes gene_type:complete